jgi:hypothetical protein
MIPKTYNFKCNYSETTFRGRELKFTDEANIPIDITGWVFRMQIRKGINGQIVKSLTNGSGFTIADAINGVVRIDAFTNFDIAFKYVYDLFVDKPNGETECYLKGTFDTEDNVTKRNA